MLNTFQIRIKEAKVRYIRYVLKEILIKLVIILGLSTSNGTTKREFHYHFCSCDFGCWHIFTIEKCREIFQNYWKTGDYQAQREFIMSMVEPPKLIQRNYEYHLPSKFANNFDESLSRLRVCSRFFMGILGITSKRVLYLFRKKLSVLNTVLPDFRGTFKNPKRLGQREVTVVESFLSTARPQESHYCRKNSKKLYFEEHATKQSLYTSYKKYCSENNERPVGIDSFKKILSEAFPEVAFRVPVKDKCDTCLEYKNIKNPTETQVQLQKKHLHMKAMSRKAKDADKELCKRDPRFVVIQFDLEKVLLTPSIELPFSRKLKTWNFSNFIYFL